MKEFEISDELMERIQKVQALEDSPNLGEAAAATAMLQKLLFKYNLELSDIETKSGDDNGIELLAYYTLKRNWAQSIVFSVARYNFCKAVNYRGSTKMEIIGAKHNLQFVRWLASYLIETLERLADESWEEYVDKYKTNKGTFKGSFLDFAVSEVDGRLYRQWLDLQAETEMSTSLVVTNQAALDRKTNEVWPKLRNAPRVTKANFSPDGAIQGMQAGKSVNLNKAVE